MLTVPASDRLWASEEANTTSSSPQLRHGAVNGDGQSQAGWAAKESVELEAPSAKRARRDISLESNGRGGGGAGELLSGKVSAVGVHSADEQHPQLLDTFCVASFSISPPKGKFAVLVSSENSCKCFFGGSGWF